MIDLLSSDEQQAIADNVAEILMAEAPVSRLRDGQAENGDLHGRLAALGWIGLALSEEDGGVGYGLAEEALLFRATGRHLLSPTFLASTLAARLAAKAGDVALAAALMSGETKASLLSPVGPALLGPTVSGAFHRFDPATTDVCIVIDASGVALFDTAAIAGAPVRGIDDAVLLERVSLDGQTARLWLPADVEPLPRRADLLVAATLAGIADGARDLSVEYAKVREQFGQPIGAFQAIKHLCADMAVRCEAAWSLVVFAALALDGDRPDAAFQVTAARLIADDAALRNAAKTIQVHGGMGFTAECDAQLFVKRARLWSAWGHGSGARLRALLAEPEPVRSAGRTSLS